MNDRPVDRMACASDSGQAPSQPSHLCQACLSVVSRDDLEITKLYPHHTDLKDFIQASRMRCYICSWMLADLPTDVQEGLRLLAEGKIPDDVIADEVEVGDDLSSHRRTTLHDSIRHQWVGDTERKRGDDISWVSLIGMRIEHTISSRNHLEISMVLNPFYEGYFPLTTTVYDKWIVNLWQTMNINTYISIRKPVIITDQDYLELGLMTASLPTNTGSMSTWKTVTGWLQQCSEQHRCQCLSQIDPDWYPTRLVEILSDHRFRIVRSDSNRFQSKGGYVTLSHRWGNSSDFIKLTASNLVDFEIGCSVTILRKTFQDAIEIASRMAIPYLWIDSLCIIQSGDGGADWREESTKMALVYSNSFCNISADWGDKFNGLFFERPGSFEPPCDVYMRWSLNSLGSWWRDEVPSLPPDGGLCHIVRPSGWSEDVMNSPLNHRGWVLQERQLASRILHFTPKGVSWECRVKTAWERAPLGFSDDAYTRSCGLFQCSTTLTQMRRLRLREPDVPVDWPKLVTEYTGCILTNQSDRLVAVAGIAKVLASTVKDQYVAGLWSKASPKALVWRQYPMQVCDPTVSYFAPTFSWAASEGMVTYCSVCQEILDDTSAIFVQHREKPLASVLDNTTRAELFGQPFTDHAFGPMITPVVEVRMQGILRTCQRIPRRLVPSRVFHTRSFACPSMDADGSAKSTCFERGTVFYISFDRTAEEEAHLEDTLYCYTIISYQPAVDNELNDSVSYKEAEGILLKSIDSSMGRFERVGHVEHSAPSGEPFKSILPPLGNERELPAWSYDESTGQHTFFIV